MSDSIFGSEFLAKLSQIPPLAGRVENHG